MTREIIRKGTPTVCACFDLVLLTLEMQKSISLCPYWLLLLFFLPPTSSKYLSIKIRREKNNKQQQKQTNTVSAILSYLIAFFVYSETRYLCTICLTPSPMNTDGLMDE